jgi:intracellular sulfur oxidation DsrE/DsrF family protein
MKHGHIALIALALTAAASPLAAPLAAQTGEALIKKAGTAPSVAAPSYPAPKNLDYKVAWDITEGPKNPEDAVEGYKVPANFFVMTDAEGVSRKKVHLAIIVHGTATQSLLTNEAYKAATGKDNASVALLTALNDAGVQVIVCGVALINRKVPRDKLLPFVKVSSSATMARAILQAQGYGTFTP